MHYHVKKAEYIKGYVLRITFASNEIFEVDLAPFLKGEVFEPLKKIENFRKFFVHPEVKVITWPNGADIAPEVLYNYAKGNDKFSA